MEDPSFRSVLGPRGDSKSHLLARPLERVNPRGESDERRADRKSVV